MSEVAIAMVLLVVAGLMMRSFLSISSVAPGFNPKGVITLGVGLPLSRYPGVQQQAIFYDKLVAQIRTLPGVESAASVTRLPMLGFNAATDFTVQGKPVQPGTEPNADYRAVTDDYFRTMGIPLLKGRDFTVRDSKDAPDAMIINEMLAERFFPGEDPVGKRIQIFPDATRWREIVGVVGNVKLLGLDAETNPTIYVPYSQNPYPDALRNVFLVARTSSDPKSLVASIRSELRSLDKDIPFRRCRLWKK